MDKTIEIDQDSDEYISRYKMKSGSVCSTPLCCLPILIQIKKDTYKIHLYFDYYSDYNDIEKKLDHSIGIYLGSCSKRVLRISIEPKNTLEDILKALSDLSKVYIKNESYREGLALKSIEKILKSKAQEIVDF